MAAYGLNLQDACHHGIIVQFPHSANTMLQCIAHIVRPGQARDADWKVLKVMFS